MGGSAEVVIQDVEMENIENISEENEAKKDQDVLTIQEIREQTRQIEKAVTSKEPRFILRVLRALPNTRRKINPIVLKHLAVILYPTGPERDAISVFIPPIAGEAKDPEGLKIRPAIKNAIPEVDVYFHMLILVRLLDDNQLEKAQSCSESLMQKIVAQNRRTLDLIAARSYFYRSRVAELTNSLDKIRGFLHARLRTATLRNDFEGQAVIINCLLRNYLHYSLYDQADKLVKKSVFPDTASNNEWARFLYYLGRIKAAKLEYSVAHKHLVQALRKAPQHAAVGFRQTVQKLIIVVELLLGNIPERQVFRQAALRKSLLPYFQLTQAVRLGNLQKFGQVVENFGLKFQQDHTYTLIIRLRHNVIKTAIRSIGLSYSRISPQEIAKKLGLDSAEDAEFVVAKAIRDGVIEATLDPEHGFMRSKESTDIYSTREPQLAFHQRISFCLDLHNQSVKAMRYPPKSYGKDLESAEERREREQQDLELAKEMAEDDDDGF
ncbi:probable 26S proteasome non-ATPase regulatory subunit 3 [Condylostylus longicornis]|uniref:probable 26S proteasome non-ATPase regulatory subunit 3 n=1 Tax=Condylostylus longicornis TaxID=2530218 RepID=UPI00244DD2BA|nr:probable 26S proteasome non-ATPase regulatory subunit 3 [Condylostylus longicornis]